VNVLNPILNSYSGHKLHSLCCVENLVPWFASNQLAAYLDTGYILPVIMYKSPGTHLLMQMRSSVRSDISLSYFYCSADIAGFGII